MSIEKIKKKPKKFYCYDRDLIKLKEINNLINNDESEIINASLFFFLSAPKSIQKEIILHFQKKVADADFGEEDEYNDAELIREILRKGLE